MHWLAAATTFLALTQLANSYDPYGDLPALKDRQVIVQLFEWRWKDIAAECEHFLQFYGYGAVQISPPNEHVDFVQNNDKPWWIRYQPVSYKLHSRSGTATEFRDMVKRCNKVGVRIIADTVLNHMVGVGEMSGKDGRNGSAGSRFDGSDGVESFPSVPYTQADFNDPRCHDSMRQEDYKSFAYRVRECRLVGLLDLDQSRGWVRSRMADYLNRMLAYGVGGFRLDASKHMWPADIKAILDMTRDLDEQTFGHSKRPFSVQEVIDLGGEVVKAKEYINNGRVTNFPFGIIVTKSIRRESDVANLTSLRTNLTSHDSLVFIDNHDNQRDTAKPVLTYKDGDQYKLAVGFMLAWDFGLPRVMSSYYFTNKDKGPPNMGAPDYKTSPPSFSYDKTCDKRSGWVCEHRWPEVRSMTYFRSVCADAPVTNITTDSDRLAFGREGKGYFALNNAKEGWWLSAHTGMTPGKYCDVYGGAKINNHCTGATVVIDSAGVAQFFVPSMRIVAFHVKSMLA